MKYSELKKILRKKGCRLDCEGSRHEIWYSPTTGLYFSVGRHNTEDCPKGTLNSILRTCLHKVKTASKEYASEI